MDKTLKSIKDIKKILSETANFLKNTSDEMLKLSKSLFKAEKDFAKIKLLDVERTRESPINQLKDIEAVEKLEVKEPIRKGGPPKRIQLEKPHPPIAPKDIRTESVDEIKLKRPEEKKDLSSVRNRITDLLDRLKEEVSIGTEISSSQIVSKDKENLSTLKSEMTQLYNRFKSIVKEDEFDDMTPEQRNRALKDMAEAIQILTDEYDK